MAIKKEDLRVGQKIITNKKIVCDNNGRIIKKGLIEEIISIIGGIYYAETFNFDNSDFGDYDLYKENTLPCGFKPGEAFPEGKNADELGIDKDATFVVVEGKEKTNGNDFYKGDLIKIRDKHSFDSRGTMFIRIKDGETGWKDYYRIAYAPNQIEPKSLNKKVNNQMMDRIRKGVFPPSIKKTMSRVIANIRESVLSEEDKLMKRFGLKDSSLNMTSEGILTLLEMESIVLGYKDYEDMLAKLGYPQGTYPQGTNSMVSVLEVAKLYKKHKEELIKRLEEMAAKEDRKKKDK